MDGTKEFQFGVEMQKKILRYMMLDRQFCGRCCHYLKADYFAGNLSWFFRKFYEYWETYKEPITPEILSNEVQKQNAKDVVQFDLDRSDICKQFLQEKEKLYIKSEMDGFIKQNLFVTTAQQAVVFYNSGQRNKAYQLMTDKLKEINEISFNQDRVMKFGSWKDAVDSASLQTANAIPTGILEIDSSLGGGLLPGTWTTFLGGSNVGKSLLCANLAYYAVMKGHNVFVTVHEDEEGPTYLRYLSRFSGVPFGYLHSTPRLLWPEQTVKAVDDADKILNQHVRISFMYGRDSTIEAVQEAMRLMKISFDYTLYLCDYGQCLKTTAFKTMDNTYSVLEHVYSELKQICLELNVAGAGGAQVNRSGHKLSKAGADFLRMSDVGDSWGICKKSSNVITINRSEKDAQEDRIIFLLDKARNGRAPIAVQCVSAYNHCVTHSDTQPQARIGMDLKPVNEERANDEYERKKRGEKEEPSERPSNVVPLKPGQPDPPAPPTPSA